MSFPADPAEILRSVYGYTTFRGLQQETIATAMASRDSLVLMPTGAGKSICYQIPMLARPGTGLVVSPLIALMQNQVAALRELGIRAEFLNSSLGFDGQRQVLEQLHAGRVDILYIAPERLLQDRTLAELAAVPLSLIAIDEAHCVSQWGHDFRVDYLELGRLAQIFPNVPRMATTATADMRTRTEIITRLALENPARFVASFDRPNIHYRVTPKTESQRQLVAFLATHRNETGIIYCLSRKRTETTVERLQNAGYHALPYHAGLPTHTRTINQNRFLCEDGLIMVATIAFGMGINKPDVRFVVHLDLPKSMENYYQETGRSGRDGAPAETLMLYGLQDVYQVRRMIDTSPAEAARKRIAHGKLDTLLGWCEITRCRRQALLAYFGEEISGTCGNCDVCLTPPDTWDGTVAAQKLLSCAVRTGQRFGAVHLLDVLMGKLTDKVSQHRHQRLPTWGIGNELDAKGWRSVLRQLVIQRYLEADPDRFNAVCLTERARPLLRGEEVLVLRKDPIAARKRTGHSRQDKAAGRSIPPGSEALWQALRSCRKQLADQAGVPPYVVFHDSTLRDMLRKRPLSLPDMLEISGVGQTKLDRYGKDFLAVLNADAGA